MTRSPKKHVENYVKYFSMSHSVAVGRIYRKEIA